MSIIKGEIFEISIHALREEGDDSLLQADVASLISIHALREEGDLILWKSADGVTDFYPRPPRGGRLCVLTSGGRCWQNFYPRPPRGGRLKPSSGS